MLSCLLWSQSSQPTQPQEIPLYVHPYFVTVKNKSQVQGWWRDTPSAGLWRAWTQCWVYCACRDLEGFAISPTKVKGDLGAHQMITQFHAFQLGSQINTEDLKLQENTRNKKLGKRNDEWILELQKKYKQEWILSSNQLQDGHIR